MAKDAVVASRIDLKDGGKNVGLTRSGWYYGHKGETIIQEQTEGNLNHFERTGFVCRRHEPH